MVEGNSSLQEKTDPLVIPNKESLQDGSEFEEIAIESGQVNDGGKEEIISEDSPREPSTARLVVILFGLWIGVLLSALDGIMLATIVGSISASFNSFSSLSWLATTYPMAVSVSQPLSGHLTDIFGRRIGLVIALSIFGTGTLICGLSPTLWVFLFGRVIQGLGGGALGPITAYVETDLVPMRKRALIEGIGNIIYGVTLALGGIYGGLIQGSLGWKWAFLIQVPIIILDILLVSFVVKIPVAKNNLPRRKRVDYVGMVGLLVVIILFQFGLNSGGATYPWVSAPVLTTLVLSGIIFTGFVYWELHKAPNPIMPIRVLIQRTVSSSQLSSFLAALGNTSIMYYIPIYLQVLGNSTAESGYRFLPLAICFAIGSFAVGWIVKVTARYFYVNIPVQFLLVLGTVMLCTMDESTPAWAPFVYLGIYGAGSGGGYVTRLMGLLSAAKPAQQSAVQAASFTIGNTGVTLGITVASALFQHLSRSKLQILFKNQPDMLQNITGNFELLNSLDASEKKSAIGFYMEATRGVFYLSMVAQVIAAVASFCMENNRLKDDDDDNVTKVAEAETSR